ncbi:MAG: putative phosphatidylinositol alpha-mannosyltransferase [Frankiales bacterium]|nr:putative phosphatidylinositol alpha-mannosyltransferase [Frankiales bacterium]
MASASIAVLSTYPPTECGLATFSAALVDQLARTTEVGIVRVLDAPDGDLVDRPGAPVVAELVNGSPASAAAAVAVLNSYDAVLVQHEYGIFGGPDGVDVLSVLDAVTVPIVVVLHTVLDSPTTRQRQILEAVVRAASAVVTMTENGRRRLIDHYGAEPTHISVIPHGAVDHRQTAHGPVERDSRPTILTWGLIGPGKGIEWAIESLRELRDLHPRYRVLGKTHPKVLERHGESYRQSLVDRAAALGVDDLLDIDPRYLTVSGLSDFVRSADVVLLPYDSPDQVTSGVLIEAVAAGRPVVATRFPHAVELLSRGVGLLVPRQDPAAIAAALRRVLTEPGLSAAMTAAAESEAPKLVWSAVAARYAQLADHLVAASGSAGLVVAS